MRVSRLAVTALLAMSAVNAASRGDAADVDRRTRAYRTAIAEARERPADFAGHYVMLETGCGAECLVLAAVDKRSARVVWLRPTVCCWADGITEPVSWSIGSRIVTVDGMLDEAGPNVRRRFSFDGTRFVALSARSSRPRTRS